MLKSATVSPTSQSVEHIDPLDELLTCRLDFRQKQSEPCTVVIFGASGSHRAQTGPGAVFSFAAKQLPIRFASSALPDGRSPTNYSDAN
jgi:hypothetical protein